MTYAGNYELPGLDKPIVIFREGGLYMRSDALGGELQELLPESETRFFILSRPVMFEFQKDEKGAISRMKIEAFGRSYKAQRTP